MKDNTKNHNQGKKNENDTWPFLEKNGYIRPSKDQRKEIKEFYSNQGKTLKGIGFDVISLDEVCLIGKKEITLYEVKTAGEKRGIFIGEGFNKFGFTLSINEKNNADILKNKYKFIFVNLYRKKFKIYKLSDFFKNNINAKTYQTWSIFIKKDLK